MTPTADPGSEFVDRPWMEGAEAPPQRPRRAATLISNRGWRVLAHASAVVSWLFFGYSPAIVVPLLIWQLKARKENDAELARTALEALNFQINVTLLSLGLSVTVIGIPLLPLVFVLGLALTTIASVQVYRGKDYRYPWIHRFLVEDAPSGGGVQEDGETPRDVEDAAEPTA